MVQEALVTQASISFYYIVIVLLGCANYLPNIFVVIEHLNKTKAPQIILRSSF